MKVHPWVWLSTLMVEWLRRNILPFEWEILGLFYWDAVAIIIIYAPGVVTS